MVLMSPGWPKHWEPLPGQPASWSRAVGQAPNSWHSQLIRSDMLVFKSRTRGRLIRWHVYDNINKNINIMILILNIVFPPNFLFGHISSLSMLRPNGASALLAVVIALTKFRPGWEMSRNTALELWSPNGVAGCTHALWFWFWKLVFEPMHLSIGQTLPWDYQLPDADMEVAAEKAGCK